MQQWVCTICGGDTSNVDYDYLINYDHVSCHLGVWGGKDIPTHKDKLKPKVMKIKGWEKISGFTYKGFTIVNPIHNAEETKYMADVLDLNQSHKPKWELNVLAPGHKWKAVNDDTFHIMLWDEDKFSARKEVSKDMISAVASFRILFEELVDEILKIRLTSAPVYSSHSIVNNSSYGKTINPNYYATNTIGGILANVNNSGTFSIYDSSTGTSINLLDTIKELQKQIEDLKNTPSNPF
jgi:hypothetical protein